jgi:hypothetical protein
MKSAARSLAIRLAACVVVALPAAGAHAAILHVGANIGCDYDDLQQAIDDADPGDIIEVAPGTYTSTDDGFVLEAKDVDILGGYGCVSGTPGGLPTVLTATEGHPVMQIYSSASGQVRVTLAHLTISGARNTSARQGGGLFIGGAGRVDLADIRISDNAASTRGGGLYIRNSSCGSGDDPLAVNLLEGTLVSGNSASVGGGIAVEGEDGCPLRLSMTSPETSIAYNTAAFGGGLSLSGTGTVVDIASTGYHADGLSLGAVTGNQAQRGAGIHATQGALARLFSKRVDVPVRIDANGRASPSKGQAQTQTGGALLLDGADACGWNYELIGNGAADGAALTINGRASFYRHEALEVCGPEPLVSLGALDCLPGAACNRINDNRQGGTYGAVVVTGGQFQAERLEMFRNGGGTLLGVHTGAAASLIGCVLGMNGGDAVHPLVTVGAAARLAMDGCTLAGNGRPVFGVDGTAEFDLTRSIVWEPGSALSNGIAGIHATDILVSGHGWDDVSGISGLRYDEPRFVDAAVGNYRLTPASPAIDASALGFDGQLDVAGYPRGVDATNHPATRYDLGAYEWQQPVETIFRDSFEH